MNDNWYGFILEILTTLDICYLDKKKQVTLDEINTSEKWITIDIVSTNKLTQLKTITAWWKSRQIWRSQYYSKII